VRYVFIYLADKYDAVHGKGASFHLRSAWVAPLIHISENTTRRKVAWRNRPKTKGTF